VTLRFDGTWPAGVRATLDGLPVAVRREAGGGIAVDVNLVPGLPHALVVR
jgi:hypothetical protein